MPPNDEGDVPLSLAAANLAYNFTDWFALSGGTNTGASSMRTTASL